MADNSKKAHPNFSAVGDEFCNYPFMQMLLQPTGVVSPCCWNQSIVLGQIQNSSLEEIWNGEAAQSLRREFLSGQPVSCRTQMNHIGCHRWSRRADQSYLTYAEIQPLGPRRLDVRLNGKCNLQCTMCDVWQQPNGVYDQAGFFEHGEKYIFPFLKEMDVLGGEPFVQRDTFRLIDMISAVNSECTWAFVTNGQYIVGPAIRQRLEKIKIRWLQVSLDSVDADVYKRIRIGGNLERAMKALYDFDVFRWSCLNEGKTFDLIVSMCVQKLNWSGIGEFLQMAYSRRMTPILQFAYDPASVSLLDLSASERALILPELERLRQQFGEVVDSVYLPIRDSLIEKPSREATL